MKIRKGFVSNSSSSSFIVTFEKVPKSKEELQKILFGERKEYPSPYGTEFFSTDQVADIVWTDMQKGPLTNRAQIREEISRGYPANIPHWLEDCIEMEPPRYEDFKKSIGKDHSSSTYDHEAFEKAYEKWAAQFERIAAGEEALQEGRVFLFEYADEDGPLGCAMEHGTLFQNAADSFKIGKH